MPAAIPIPGTARARLLHAALAAFGAHGYEPVAVAALAAEAGVTTGALYHHFAGKEGLYAIVREEAERRVLDRMEGAAAARADAETDRAVSAQSALLVGFDYVAGAGIARLLSEAPREADLIEAFLARARGPIAARLIAAAWRAALASVADGRSRPAVRRALSSVARPA